MLIQGEGQFVEIWLNSFIHQNNKVGIILMESNSSHHAIGD